jgi:signal transduction histidine kinase
VAVEVPPESASLVGAARMDAAARTAGALAHQLANYLGTIRGMLYLVGDRLTEDAAAREDFDVLARAVDGLAAFVESLRRFAHPAPLGAGSADLNAVLREAEPALREALRPGATLVLDLAPAPLEVRGDAARTRELALDLVVAAVHTLGSGGRLQVETSLASGGGGGAPAALLVVRVDGPGLDPERARRIFEPFVLDQAYDGGLRLPTAYETVAASGGTMEAESRPGAGTTIRVTLPLAPATARRPTAR